MKMRERIQELRLATCGLRLLEQGGDPREHEQWGVTDGQVLMKGGQRRGQLLGQLTRSYPTPMEIHEWDSLWVFGANTPRPVIQSCLSLVWMY